jgi:hypothetical protein
MNTQSNCYIYFIKKGNKETSKKTVWIGDPNTYRRRKQEISYTQVSKLINVYDHKLKKENSFSCAVNA